LQQDANWLVADHVANPMYDIWIYNYGAKRCM
jgi:hypothetical protein